MRVPNIFRPEKISDEKIKSLESAKEKDIEIGSLTDFILNEKPYAKYAFSSKIHDLTYKRLYPSIKKTDLTDDLCILYNSGENRLTPALDILKFQDAQTMIKNISNMIECTRKLNVNYSLKVYLMVNGSYACFIHISDYEHEEEIIDTYKEKFGFKEIRQ